MFVIPTSGGIATWKLSHKKLTIPRKLGMTEEPIAVAGLLMIGYNDPIPTLIMTNHIGNLGEAKHEEIKIGDLEGTLRHDLEEKVNGLKAARRTGEPEIVLKTANAQIALPDDEEFNGTDLDAYLRALTEILREATNEETFRNVQEKLSIWRNKIVELTTLYLNGKEIPKSGNFTTLEVEIKGFGPLKIHPLFATSETLGVMLRFELDSLRQASS